MKRSFILLHRLLKAAILPMMLILFNNSAYSQTTYYDNYAFRIPLTLNNASLGIVTDQTNFVALLKVTSPAFVSAVCSDQTGALSSAIPVFAIVDSAYSTATELNYQVENYNAATGVIYFWVKMPVLYKTGSVNGSNKLYCYFGSTSPSVTHSTAWQKLTWSGVTATAGINYSGVWHFNEDPAGPAPQFSDATVNNNNLSVGTSGAVTQNTLSQIGNGITLSATSVLDIGATGMPNTQASQSLSIWASYPSIPATTANLIVLENSTNPALTGNGTQLGLLVNAGVTDVQTWRWANRLTPLVKYATPPTAVTWHHYAYTYDAVAKNSYLYIDGTLVTGPTSNTGNPPFAGTVDMVAFGDYINNNIGGSGLHVVGGQSYTGTMDESHIIGATLSADWVKAEYVNQKNPAAFTTSGAIQTNVLRASAVPGYLNYTWKGASTNITSANNWDNTTAGVLNQAPVSANVNWVIPSGLANYPILTVDTALYALNIASGAYINLNGHVLKVGCNIYNSSGGQILYGGNNTSKITWNGSLTSQNYYGTNTALTAQVGAMEVNNSSAGTVSISGGPVDIFNLLTITKGNLVVNASPAALTLKSSSTLSASVGVIPSAYSITGNVNVERYISGGSNTYRGYRFLSSPIYTVQSGSNYYYDMSYLTSYAPTTGSTGVAGGFTKTGNATMYLYRDNVAFTNSTFNTGNFRGVNKINNAPLYSVGVDFDGTFNLHVGTGFFFFYRGDFTNIANKYTATTSAESNIFMSTGTLNQQAVTVTNWYTGLNTLQFSTVVGNAGYSGYNLVGNPYASSIDWNTYSATVPTAGIYAPSVNNTIYIYNETSKVYATYSGGVGTNGGSNIIPAGQGFFVKANALGASLTFNESAKTTAQVTGPTQTTGSTLLLSTQPVTNNVLQYLRLELDADSVNKEETIVRFNSSAKNEYVVNEDSQYFIGNGEVGLSTMSTDNYALAINNIPLPKHSQAIKLNVSATTNGVYKLNMTQIKAVPQLYDVWLMDAHKKDSLNMRSNNSYAFDVDLADTTTFGSNRFQLVIRQNPALGVHLLDFTATKATNGAQVTWKTENEQNYTNFTVERSTDNGKTFDVLGGFLSSAGGTYSYLDKEPLVALNQYRLKLEDLNGTISYSGIAPLLYSTLSNNVANNAITVYPNPANNTLNLTIDRTINLTNALATASINDTVSGQDVNQNVTTMYSVKIFSSVGAIVKTMETMQPSSKADVSNLPPGEYIIQVVNNTNKSIVGQSTFVKL